MKKTTIFPLIVMALLLASCTPQVTVTSEVTVTLPPPTETPFPTLTPTPIAVDGIAEDAEGNKLAYLDGEWTVLPVLDDDYKLLADADGVRALDENGAVKYALNMETGEWVETESAAMQQTNKILEDYGVDLETVTVTEEGGAVNVVDEETGKVLIKTIGENSKFDLGFAVDTIAAKSCEPKPDLVPSSSGLMLAENGDAPISYFENIGNELDYKLSAGARFWFVLIDRERQCWGVIQNDGSDLLYRDEDGAPKRIPLIGLTKLEVEAFVSDR